MHAGPKHYLPPSWSGMIRALLPVLPLLGRCARSNNRQAQDTASMMARLEDVSPQHPVDAGPDILQERRHDSSGYCPSLTAGALPLQDSDSSSSTPPECTRKASAHSSTLAEWWKEGMPSGAAQELECFSYIQPGVLLGSWQARMNTSQDEDDGS